MSTTTVKTLKSPMRKLPERILVYGPPGSLKSTNWLQIARRCPDAKFFVIDADETESTKRLLATEFTDVLGRGQVEVKWIDPDDWDSWVEAIAEYVPQVGEDDWLIIDPASPSWAAIQEDAVDRFYNYDLEEYYEAVRKNDKARMEGWKEWPIIKKRYAKALWRPLRRLKGHYYLTARAKKLGERESPETRAAYGLLGSKPEGQDVLGHIPHTVLCADPFRGGGAELTTVKDRGRKSMNGVEIKNFPLQYLAGIAGWKMQEVEVPERDAEAMATGSEA